jgi:hypothetical protein
MKTLFITLLMTTSLIVNAQQMENKINIQETISKLFVNSDNRIWDEVEAQFAPKVMMDYSSMTGNAAAEVSPKDITTSWKSVLPGFTYTHHQIGNFITEVNGNKAHSFCYGTATHFLEDENGNIWTVVGSYDFDLEKIDGSWKITAMTFNYKYQNGNSKLIEKAIENAKNN